MIVQFFGILLAVQLFNNQTFQTAVSEQIASAPVGALFFLAYVILISVILLVIIRHFKTEKIIIIWERVVIFITSFFVFYVVLSSIFSAVHSAQPTGIGMYVFAAASAILAGLLLYSKQRYFSMKNAAAIISSIGVGLLLGLGFGPLAAIVIIALLAVYDFVAVFVTKHMITLADIAVKNRLALMVDVSEYEAVPRSSLSREQLSYYGKAVRSKLVQIPEGMKNLVKGTITMPASAALGTGDLAIPLMLSVSMYKLYLNFTLSIFIAIGGTFGLILTMFILRKYKRALPAIPPILLGILCSMLAYSLIFNALPF